MVRETPRQSCRERGQAIVEFAFILPVLLILVLGMFEVGRAFVFGVAAQDGAREAARVAANARLNAGITDAAIIQRFVDASAPAMQGCSVPVPVSATPVTFNCGGGNWTLTMKVTPTGSTTSYSTFASVPSTSLAQLNGGTVEVKAVGSVSVLAGFASGWAGMSLYQVTVQGDAVMVIL